MNIGYAAPAAGALDRVEVVEAAREGCDTAWRQIFDEHYPQMYRFFRARVSSHEEAEDLAAEVFAQAVRCIRKFEWRGRPFGSWLYGIARRQLASFYRSKPSAEPAMETSHARHEYLGVEIRDILERLTPDHRAALELRFVIGLSGIEAATVMRRSHGSFRSLLLRAVRAFRRESDDERGCARREGAAPGGGLAALTRVQRVHA